MVIKINRALISTYDKTGLPDLGSFLVKNGVEIVSTGGTSRFLDKVGIVHKQIEAVTGFPEILGGRVKTLHPAVHAGILANQADADHMAQIESLDIKPFQLVVVNLYPFREVVARGCSDEEAIENIDIGGPTMARAAAKNHRNIVIVTDPADYHRLIRIIEEEGGIPLEISREMSLKAFSLTAAYDAAIVEVFSHRWESKRFPEHDIFTLHRVGKLRYGENSHQDAALYSTGHHHNGLPYLCQSQGKALSFNNMVDIDAAWRMVSDLDAPAAVVVKHSNPCGMGLGKNIVEAFQRALACDPKSAFGGIIALSDPCTAELAEIITKNFVEVVIAPDYEAQAREIFAKKKRLRVISLPLQKGIEGFDVKRVWGGFLLQAWDNGDPEGTEWKVVTKRQPTEEERKALAFAWKAARHVKSNAIVFANAYQTVGIGAGQMSRVDSVELAVRKAVLPIEGTVAASDAFFPFRDNVDAIAQSGATAIIQPGGSIRDEETIAAADEHGLAMVFTGIRHFKH